GPASIPVVVTWSARDAVAGLSDATVSVKCGEGQVQRSEAPGSAAPDELVDWRAEAAVFPDSICSVTAIGKDGAGNSTRRTVKGVVARVVATSDDTLASDDTVASAVVQGDQVGVIARRGPSGGRAAITLDGNVVGEIDLWAPDSGGAEVVFVLDLEPGVSHQLRVEATGTSDPASTGSAIAIDGFVTLSLASSAA
ncbi:MAG: hypothetical protein ACC726_02580, partial [Chloroflexota bacterium]